MAGVGTRLGASNAALRDAQAQSGPRHLPGGALLALAHDRDADRRRQPAPAACEVGAAPPRQRPTSLPEPIALHRMGIEIGQSPHPFTTHA